MMSPSPDLIDFLADSANDLVRTAGHRSAEADARLAEAAELLSLGARLMRRDRGSVVRLSLDAVAREAA
jgi:hypothetical protein